MSSSPVTPLRKTIVYVDGFNLYFGLVAQGWRKYLWLNLNDFGTALLLPGQRLVCVKYFTARVTAPADKASRQGSYLAAIRTLPNVTTITGRYEAVAVNCHECQLQIACPKCQKKWFDHNEKMTDVNIATHLIVDAYQGRFDDAILISGDADQRPALEAVIKLFKPRGTRVFVCFPPSRKSYDLESAASGIINATEEQFRKSQFPIVVDTAKGRTVTKPTSWGGKP